MFDTVREKFKRKFKIGDKVIAVRDFGCSSFKVKKGEVGVVESVDYIFNDFDVEFIGKGSITEVSEDDIELYDADASMAYKCGQCTYVFNCTHPTDCVIKRMEDAANNE